MLRRIAIGLCLLATLVVMIPLVSSTAHNLRAQFSSASQRRRHSRAWWRRHRATLRRRQAMLARRRAMRAVMLARRNGIAPTEPKVAGNHATIPTTLTLPPAPATTSNAALPNGWAPVASTGAGSSFRIAPAAGPEASATLTLVAPTTGSQPFGREQKKMVGGASYTELRRTVIDRMVSAGGWVVNDRQREISGRRVFEVIAQTPSSDGKPGQVWNFYFAEIEGKVYALTTRTAGNHDKVAADAEKFISAFSPAQLQAKKK
ncbi:MAG: hypothetical protein ACT4OT_10495 [Acidobacteriota bacterium]